MKILICYFSGTGNTTHVTNKLSEALQKLGAQVRLEFITRELVRHPPDPSAYDIIGIGHPIHAFDAPSIVYDFIRALPETRAFPTFTFKVPGDPIGHGGSAGFVLRALGRRGYRVFHQGLYVMPANLAIRFADEFVRQLDKAVARRADLFAREIVARRRRMEPVKPLTAVFTWLFSAGEHRGAKRVGRRWQASDVCIGCGVCVRECPTENIRLVQAGNSARPGGGTARDQAPADPEPGGAADRPATGRAGNPTDRLSTGRPGDTTAGPATGRPGDTAGSPATGRAGAGPTVTFGNQCILCLHCYYACPVGAISHSQIGCVLLQDGYDSSAALNDDQGPSEWITPHTRGYFAHYWTYLSEV